MPDRKNVLTILFAATLAFQAIGCGSSNSNRVLQSMTVTPLTADGNTSPIGQVVFTATGRFSKAPSPSPVTFVAPYSGSWSVSDPSIATLVATGTGDGTATFQCVAGASGVATISAIASSNAASGTGATSTAVTGTAKLTCP
jgi:hypothetical protein